MGKKLIIVLLIGLIVLYSGYNLISSSDKNIVDSSNIYINLELTDNSNDLSKSINKQIRISPALFMVDNIIDTERAEKVGLETIGIDNIIDLERLDKVEVDTKEVTVEVEIKRESLMKKIRIHRVQKGESLWVIARKYNINIDTLIGANDIANMNRIKIGDELRILPVKGILYKINPGESLWTISKQFNVSIAKIAEANAIDNPDLVQPGMTLLLPGAKPEFGYQDRLGKRFIYPANARISSYFGPRWGRQHEGIDFAVNVGTEVKAARAGKVIYSQWANGYGYTVVIEHQKGVRTLYAHNSRLLVRGGQWVEQGQAISLSGNTGNSTGPHLHFEVQINGQPVNPLNYIEK